MRSEPLHDPNQGYTLRLDRDGDDLIVDCTVEPGGGVPTHTHPNQVEHFEILEGSFRFRCGRKRVVLGPGDEVTVPKGTKHWFRNVGETTGRHRARLTPALNGEGFFEDTTAMAREGLITKSRMPTSFRGAVTAAEVIDRYRDDVKLSWPPRFMLAPLLLFRNKSAS